MLFPSAAFRLLLGPIVVYAAVLHAVLDGQEVMQQGAVFHALPPGPRRRRPRLAESPEFLF